MTIPPVIDNMEAIFHIINTLPTPLSPTKFQVLFTIARNPGLNLTELCSILNRERTHITKCVSYLAELGLIEKRHNHATNLLYTTAEGEKYYHTIHRCYIERVEKLKKIYHT